MLAACSVESGTSEALARVRLPPLMARTVGRPEMVIALIDGPVAPSLVSSERICAAADYPDAVCAAANSVACVHGTLTAAILFAARGSPAPAICPGCTLLVHPVFPTPATHADPSGSQSSATAEALANALAASVEAGAHVVNLSLTVLRPSAREERLLGAALDVAARRGVIVVAAAGNHGAVSGSVLSRHPWVIPVAACDLSGAPLRGSNLGASIGRRGLTAPGEGVTSLCPDGTPLVVGGTSVAAPFVTGAIALLWSAHPEAPATRIKQAVLRPHAGRPPAIVPPLLDAWGALRFLDGNDVRGA